MTIKEFFKTDIKDLLRFVGYSIILGIPLNFSLFIIFKIPFTFYSWIGWGIALWFIEKKIVPMLRGIFIR